MDIFQHGSCYYLSLCRKAYPENTVNPDQKKVYIELTKEGLKWHCFSKLDVIVLLSIGGSGRQCVNLSLVIF